MGHTRAMAGGTRRAAGIECVCVVCHRSKKRSSRSFIESWCRDAVAVLTNRYSVPGSSIHSRWSRCSRTRKRASAFRCSIPTPWSRSTPRGRSPRTSTRPSPDRCVRLARAMGCPCGTWRRRATSRPDYSLDRPVVVTGSKMARRDFVIADAGSWGIDNRRFAVNIVGWLSRVLN